MPAPDADRVRWNRLYVLVVAVLALEIAAFWALTRALS